MHAHSSRSGIFVLSLVSPCLPVFEALLQSTSTLYAHIACDDLLALLIEGRNESKGVNVDDMSTDWGSRGPACSPGQPLHYHRSPIPTDSNPTKGTADENSARLLDGRVRRDARRCRRVSRNKKVLATLVSPKGGGTTQVGRNDSQVSSVSSRDSQATSTKTSSLSECFDKDRLVDVLET